MRNARLLDVINYLHPTLPFKYWFAKFNQLQDCFAVIESDQLKEVKISTSPDVVVTKIDPSLEVYRGVFTSSYVYKITSGTVDWYIEYDPASSLKNQSFTRDFLCHHMKVDPNATIMSSFILGIEGFELPPAFSYDIHVAMLNQGPELHPKTIEVSTQTEIGFFTGVISDIRHHTDRVSFKYEGSFSPQGFEQHRFPIKFDYEGRGVCTPAILAWNESLRAPGVQTLQQA